MDSPFFAHEKWGVQGMGGGWVAGKRKQGELHSTPILQTPDKKTISLFLENMFLKGKHRQKVQDNDGTDN